VKKRIKAISGVEVASVTKQCLRSGGRVLRTTRVGEEGAESLCGVVAAGGVVKEGLKTKSGVVDAAAQALKCLSALSGIVSCIATVRRRTNRLRDWGEH